MQEPARACAGWAAFFCEAEASRFSLPGVSRSAVSRSALSFAGSQPVSLVNLETVAIFFIRSEGWKTQGPLRRFSPGRSVSLRRWQDYNCVMAKNRTFTLECPCCGASLEIDAATGKILFSKESTQTQKDFSFDGQLERIRKQKEQADQLFSKAFHDEAERKKLLERKFEEAQKRAHEDKAGPPPRNPLDLD